MFSYRLDQFGSVDHLRRYEENVPAPARHQVLIKVHAVSLNYRDLAIALGTGTLQPEPGLIPLSDGAGEVVALGEDVSRFQPGDRVAGIFFPHWIGGVLTPQTARVAYGSREDGWLTQYKVVDEQALVALPDYLSYQQAATLPCAAVTAWNSLTTSRVLQAGETVLTQGTGGVALFSVQFAKLMGLKVIALTSGADKAELLSSLGADHVINYRQVPEWHTEVRRLTGGEGVQRVVEVGGPGTLYNSMRSCAMGAEIAMLGFVAQGETPIDFMTLFKSGATLRPFSVGSRDNFEQMNRALTSSQLQPVISQVFSFEQTAEAWRFFAQRRQVGKVVISLDAHHAGADAGI